MKGLLADLKHAIRLYGRTPGATLIAIGALAIGMAFVGAFVSLYVDLLLKPHPGIEDSGEIVTIGQVDGSSINGIPIALIERMNEEVTSIETAIGLAPAGLSTEVAGEFIQFEAVTAGFFESLRPRLALGRGLEPIDYQPDAERVIVLSDTFWRERFDASPNVLGTTLEFPGGPPANDDATEVDAIEFRIVGVMAPEMRGLFNTQAAFWVPVEAMLTLWYGNMGIDIQQIRPQLTLLTLARLSAGATPDSVARELAARYPQSTDEYRLTPGFRFDAVRGVVSDINVHRDAERQLNLFLSGSLLLALVAAANVTLFLLARAPGRRRELAIRMSVGAPVRRLARQLASEASVLLVVAASLGLLVSLWLVNFLRGLAFLRQAQWDDATLLDWRVLSLVGAFLLVLAVGVSLAPILGLRRLGIASSSRHVAARATLAQRLAGSLQIAVAGALGGAAVAFGLHFGGLVLGYPGYEVAERHYVSFNPNLDGLSGSSGFIASMTPVEVLRHREVLESIPGIRRASWASFVPALRPRMGRLYVDDPGDPTVDIAIGSISIDDAFVDILGLRLLHGRAPAKGEQGVAVVNQALARRFFGRDNVVGESLPIRVASGPRTEIVGVLEDLSFVHPSASTEPVIFAVRPPSPFGPSAILETSLPAGEAQQRLQDAIDSGELELGRPNVRPLETLRADMIAPDKARSLLTISTAVLVVLLAAFGFYGTQRYLVMSGRREYAIRASLGAGPKALRRLVLGRGLALGLPGLVLGTLLAFIVVGLLRGDFVDREIDPVTVTAIVVVALVALLLLASIGPARHAARTEPAPLLKQD